MRKGQIQQVFIYIVAIVIVGIILLIGYRAISGLTDKACQVEKTTFKSSLESYITKYSSYGSLHRESLNAPCSYANVCFVNTTAIIDEETLTQGPDVIKNSVKDGIEQNIFLVKSNFTEPFGFMTEIEVEKKIICINNTNGKFYIKFEGLGKKTIISSGVS
ncbi:hypothetical protein HQ533_01370 [Candidatus Woesearchaeota archaeon]|nr:hypothetical protein [Candidatus Woesearchaeota archaeon]